MKVSQAQFRINQIDERLSDIDVLLHKGPKHRVNDLLTECQDLLQERYELDSRVLKTLLNTDFEDGSLYNAQEILNTLNTKMSIIRVVYDRGDLDSEQVSSIVKQYDKFSAAKDALQKSIYKLLSEIDLLE